MNGRARAGRLRAGRVLAVAALLAVTGCFGRGGEAVPSPSKTETPNPGERGIDGQLVVVARGAQVAEAALVQTCEADACMRVDGTGAGGRLTTEEPRPVLAITFEIEPDAVQGVVRRDGRRGEPEELSPGTLVAWRPLVLPGRSELRIVATYGTQRLEWRARIVRA